MPYFTHSLQQFTGTLKCFIILHELGLPRVLENLRIFVSDISRKSDRGRKKEEQEEKLAREKIREGKTEKRCKKKESGENKQTKKTR
jgi:hypothetical protein